MRGSGAPLGFRLQLLELLLAFLALGCEALALRADRREGSHQVLVLSLQGLALLRQLRLRRGGVLERANGVQRHAHGVLSGGDSTSQAPTVGDPRVLRRAGWHRKHIEWAPRSAAAHRFGLLCLHLVHGPPLLRLGRVRLLLLIGHRLLPPRDLGPRHQQLEVLRLRLELK